MHIITKTPLFNIANWYWVVAASATQVYSSSSAAYVLTNDPTYTAWLAAGNMPTTIAVEQDLFDMLSTAGVPLPAGSTVSDRIKGNLFDGIPQLVKAWALAVDNRVRVLEGQPTRSPAQFKNYVKSLLT